MLARLIESLWKALWADVDRQHENSETPDEAVQAGRVDGMPSVSTDVQDEDVFIIPAQPLYWNRIGDTVRGRRDRESRWNRGRPRENL